MKELDNFISLMDGVLARFVASIDESYQVLSNDEFCSLPFDGIICWSILANENAEVFRRDFLQRFSFAEPFSFFTLAFLHEVGHCETCDEMDDDTSERMAAPPMERYINLPNERLATDWAGWWISNNYEAALTLDRQVTKIIEDFYEKVLD